MWTRWPRRKSENWVFEGAECSPGETRCLIRLSRGGGDAVVVREYDLKAKRPAADGFSLPEAKRTPAYLDDDTVLFATALDGELTTSGYARIVKQWQRGEPLAAAKMLYRRTGQRCGVSPAVFHAKDGDVGVVIRAVSFFETEYFLVGNGDGRRSCHCRYRPICKRHDRRRRI